MESEYPEIMARNVVVGSWIVLEQDRREGSISGGEFEGCQGW